MEGPIEQVIEHPKSPSSIDATTSGFTYDSLADLDYLWYPHTTAFGMPSLPLPSPGGGCPAWSLDRCSWYLQFPYYIPTHANLRHLRLCCYGTYHRLLSILVFCYKSQFSPFMILIIGLRNDGTTLTLSM